MKHRGKSLLCVLCLIACLLSFSGSVSAKNGSTRTVRVGFFRMSGYHDVSRTGERSGYGYQFLQRIRFYNNWKYDYVGYDKSWAESVSLLRLGQIDLLSSPPKTEALESEFAFSERSIGSSSTMLTVKAGNAQFVSGKYATYEGIRVGMLADNSNNDSLARFAEEKGFSYNPVYFGSISSLTSALQSGIVIDAVVTSDLRNVRNEWVLDKFDSAPFYAMVRKEDTALLKEINTAIEQLDMDYPDWRTELFNSYYTPDSGSQIAFTLDERNYIETAALEQTVLTAAVNPDRAPYSYFENGVAKGIMVDAFRKMADQVGLQYEIIPTADRTAYQKVIEEGKADIWIDACQDYNEAEARGYVLTMPYMTTSVARITKRNSTAPVNTVAVLKNAGVTGDYRYALYSENPSTTFETLDECVQAVRSGKASCAYAYVYSAQAYMEKDVERQLLITVLPEYSISLCVGVSQSQDSRLASILGKSIRCADESFMQKTIGSYIEKVERTISLKALIYDYPLVAGTAIFLFAAMLFVLMFTHFRFHTQKKQQAQKEELARFLGYVCEANSAVWEVNLSTMLSKQYKRGADGNVTVTETPYTPLQESSNPELSKKIQEMNISELVETGGEGYFECQEKNENGQTLWYSYTFQAIPQSRVHPCNFILFKKNIDDVKKEEERKKQELSEALAQAQSANEAKSTFLSSMSHEIRTPLNAIMGFNEIQKQEIGNAALQKECLEKSQQASKYLLSLINDILDMSKLESGKLRLTAEPFALEEVFKTVNAMIRSQATLKRVTYRFVSAESQAVMLIGDKLRVEQILMNLLNNAIKFTESGGTVCLSIDPLSVTDGVARLHFSVSDTGIGIAPDFLPKLFVPFVQEHEGKTARYGGTGLGLSISQTLARMMDGDITVESGAGKGSVFTVTLLLKQFSGAVPRPDGKTAPTDYRFDGKRLLLCEDHKMNVMVARHLLEGKGAVVEVAENGAEGVNRFCENPVGYYDAILMDMRMPVMDGLAATRAIRALSRLDAASVPIIAMTANAYAEDREETKNAGMNAHLAKPVDPSLLYETLATFLFG